VNDPESLALAISSGAERLRAAGFDTPRLDAEILLRHVLKIDRARLFTRLREPLAPADRAQFDALIDRRLNGAPVAYLTGEREFMGLPFQIGPGALVPRPETELLVERALSWLNGRPGARVLDVGTGSGAIAVSIAKLCPNARVIATDLSADALVWAARNAEALDAAVEFARCDLASCIGGPVDLLLANLPYLRPDQFSGNPELHAEPEIALVSGPVGLNAIRRLIADAPRFMAANGAIGLEIDPSQTSAANAIVQTCFPQAIITTHADLAGFNRHIWARLG
jgi:release factor glutamine methyltransferase